MCACAEGEPRVETNHFLRLRWRFMPGRNNPELGRDFDRRELRLREADPVLVLHRLDAEHLASRKEILKLQKR